MEPSNTPEVYRIKNPDRFEAVKEFLISKTGKITTGSFFALFLVGIFIFGPEGKNVDSSGFETGRTGFATTPGEQPIPLLREYSESRVSVDKTEGSHRPPPVKLTGPKLVPRVLALNLPEGATAEAELVTGAKSGPVKTKLLEDLKNQFGERLLPVGTVLMGSAQASADRLQVVFKKAVLPDGDILKVSALALDAGDKTPGIKGSFVTKQGVLLAGSVALNTLGGVAEGLQENEAVGAGVVRKSNLRNAALNGASRAALDQARDVTQSFRESSKDIAVSAGTKIFVFFGDSSEGGQ